MKSSVSRFRIPIEALPSLANTEQNFQQNRLYTSRGTISHFETPASETVISVSHLTRLIHRLDLRHLPDTLAFRRSRRPDAHLSNANEG